MRSIVLALNLLALAACDGDATKPTPAGQWEIGPVIEGRNYSQGLPRYTSGSFNISPTAQPHYVTKSGNRMPTRLRFTVTGPLVGVGCTGPATVSLYFATRDNDWRSDGGRWWGGQTFIDHAGEYEIIAGQWGSVDRMTETNSPSAFVEAKTKTARVGFTFGNCEGQGHGATAVGSTVFKVNNFSVE